MLSNDWSIMYEKAKEVLQERQISKFIEAGSVAAAIKTVTGNIYVGVCFDTSCSLGMCAERNAIFQGHLLGYKKEDYLQLCIVSDSNDITSPCGACRQVLSELFNEEAPIYCANIQGKYLKTNIKELLPYSFSGENLKK